MLQHDYSSKYLLDAILHLANVFRCSQVSPMQDQAIHWSLHSGDGSHPVYPCNSLQFRLAKSKEFSNDYVTTEEICRHQTDFQGVIEVKPFFPSISIAQFLRYSKPFRKPGCCSVSAVNFCTSSPFICSLSYC